jgi:hypothetical protein
MARGWASKSAVIRADGAELRPEAHNTPDPATLDLIRKKESILLSRTRIVTELKSAQNPRYIQLLNRALADLDSRLSTLRGN